MGRAMDKRLTIAVPAAFDGCTVKDVARKCLLLSSTRLKKAKRIPNGILLDGQCVFVTQGVRAGQELSIIIEESGAASANIVPVVGEIDVVHEDDALLIVNKPAGMPVHPSAGHFDDSLANLVVARYEYFVFRPVNRLDAGTSGLMVIAKDAHVHALLARSLHTGCFERRYLAVVEGVFDCMQGMVDAPIARVEGSAIKRCVDASGQSAITHFCPKANRGGYSLVELMLETGRTHQIRVHMAHIGHPLAGDFLYGTEDAALISRAALHAWKLRLVHPITGQWIEYERQMPADMRRIMQLEDG